jgi:predicted signal transduction protein with EAL and GGDEF domain
VHDNAKNIKLVVAPDDMTLTLQEAITRNVQWRRTSIDINPSVAALALTTTSQSHTALVRYFKRHNLTRCSHVHLQFEGSHVHLHLRLRVP